MVTVRSIFTLSPFKISLGYFIFGVLWIPTTDIALALLIDSQQLPSLVGLLKGWTFILLSALLIYGLSHTHHQQMKTSQEKLETTNQQFQVLNRVLRHNIRNDLNLIQGYTETLIQSTATEKSRPQLEIVRQTAERIITISDKLTIVQDIETTSPSDDAIDLAEIVRTESERTRSQYDDTDVTTELPSHAWVRGDESIRYAIREVFENAAVHNTSPACNISASVTRSEEMVRLTIADDGPGIAADEIRALQLEEESSLVHTSSIGLWTIKWVTELHDGNVRFESSATEGTTVRFTFQPDPHAALLESQSRLRKSIDFFAR